jgi:hypothetical protein
VRLPRLEVLLVLVLATSAMILPFLDWYAALAPRGELRSSGVKGSAELWVVVLLAALTVAAAIILAARPGPAFVGPVAIALILVGLAMTGWSAEAYYDVPVVLSVDDAGTARDLSADVWRRWPGLLTVALSAGIALVGIAAAWSRRRP